MAAVEAERSESASTPQYLSKDIRDLQVMQDRVLADNPLEDETESPLGEIVPAEWRVVRLEHTEPNGTRHIIERGMPLDELTTVTARPSASTGDFEVDDSWQRGDPLPEYFDESRFPIDPSVVAAMLAERSAASDDVAGLGTALLKCCVFWLMKFCLFGRLVTRKVDGYICTFIESSSGDIC